VQGGVAHGSPSHDGPLALSKRRCVPQEVEGIVRVCKVSLRATGIPRLCRLGGVMEISPVEATESGAEPMPRPVVPVTRRRVLKFMRPAGLP
jgi:hypothetical protein